MTEKDGKEIKHRSKKEEYQKQKEEENTQYIACAVEMK